jgi:hypothetical protein
MLGFIKTYWRKINLFSANEQNNDNIVFFEVESAIGFIYNLGLQIQITEDAVLPSTDDILIVSSKILTKSGNEIATGLSLTNSSAKQYSRCLAIFESVERLFFLSFTSSTVMNQLLSDSNITTDDILNLKATEFYRNDKNEIYKTVPFSKHYETKNSTGWALGGSVSSSCERARNEVIERIIVKNLKSYINSIEIISIEKYPLGKAVIEIAKNCHFELNAIAINFELNNYFTLVVMYDKKRDIFFWGSSFAESTNREKVINKSLSELLTDYYFIEVTKDQSLGRNSQLFNVKEFQNIINIASGQIQNASRTSLLFNSGSDSVTVNGFIFKVYKAENKKLTDLYITQAIQLGDY